LKIGLDQWLQLGLHERLAFCHLPADSDEEREVTRTFMREVVRTRCGAEVKELPDEARRTADPPAMIPEMLVRQARASDVIISQKDWEELDGDERYALIKLGGSVPPSHNLAAALHEFLRR
jgi:hypothetical protein